MSQDLFAQKYRLLGEAPPGDAVVARRALAPSGEEVVVKLVSPVDGERFLADMQVAAGITDPHLARVLDSGIDGGRHFVVQEVVEGVDLEALAATPGALAADQVAMYGAQAAAGLATLHHHGLLHGGVKPATMVRTPDGAVKLTDTGLRRAAGAADLTQAAPAAAGRFVSPEEALGRPLLPASDIYCLGLALYRLATGTPAFDGPNAEAVAQQQVQGVARAPSQLARGVPPAFDDVVLRALNKDPELRYQTADGMRADLERVVSSEATIATSVMPAAAAATPTRVMPPPAEKKRRKWPWILAIAVVAVVAAAAVAWAAGAFNGSPTPSPSPSPSASVTMVTVPDVAGMSQSRASSALANAGLQLGEVAKVYSSNVPVGQVISQAPAAGTKAPSASKVSVAVSEGPVPTQSPQAQAVPDVVGDTQSAAVKAITAVGYTAVVLKGPSASVPSGTVISQSPSGGVIAKPASSVTIVVSTGPTATPSASP